MLRKMRRFAKWGLLVAVVALVGGEAVARYGLGLGDPPLSMAHTDIEYVFRPNQECLRFGNRVAYNAYSMRSDEMSRRKSDPNEFRVLVLGDSVVNGGNLTDQADLATEILQRELRKRSDRPVAVANVSAGSWGPGNLLAYVEVFGVFDADVVFVVLSSHDATDVPQFGNLVGTANFPDVKPKWALSEAMFRYLPRYLPNWKRTESQAAQVDIEQIGDERDYPAGPAFAQLLERLDQAGAVVIFLQHADRSELEGGFMLGHEQMAATARAQAEENGSGLFFGPPLFVPRQPHLEPRRTPTHW